MSCIFRVLKTQGDEKLSERLSKNECSTRSCQSHSTAWATIIDNAACSTTGRLLLLILLLSTFSCSPPRAKVINSSVSLSAIYTWIVNVCRSEWYRHRTAVLFSRGCRIVSSRSNLGKLFTLMSLCHWLPWRTILGWKKINLESLELRRLRADLTLVYKTKFCSVLFVLRVTSFIV